MTEKIIGTRLRALRKKRGLSQEELSRLLGFKDRQTVSAIETGLRRMSAAELLLAMEKLTATLDDFTDPFRLDGEAQFSWRQTGVGKAELGEYEKTASCWIGAYRALARQIGHPMPLMRQSLGLNSHSRFEDATDAGERFAADFEMGAVPARRLASVMQEQLGILVLMVDAYRGISGAACRLPELDVVLIARGEVAGRRNFDLAHELFHILTWEAMPPEHVENALETGGGRVEQLANNFAAAVLMPEAALRPYDGWEKLDMDELIARLNAVADELEVTSSALRWRLVALRELSGRKARAIPETALRYNGRESRAEAPLLFSASFLEVISQAIERGFLSVRRAASLTGLMIEDLEELISAHDICQTTIL
ncbi:MAG: XRE family transcriptional regulator [Gammaproteobacteria bacterium]|nr:XRE family transcriptional regulator [Gammaproteobacteria bacterium]